MDLPHEEKVRLFLIVEEESDFTHPELDPSFDLEVFPVLMEKQADKIPRIIFAMDDKAGATPDKIAILDVTGGNDFEDLSSLLSTSREEGERFACAYVKPRTNGMGCWLMDNEVFDELKKGNSPELKEMMLDLARQNEMELWELREY